MLTESLVPPRAKGKRGKDAIVPLSGLDVDALLSKKPKISRDNAIPEFKQMLKTTTDDKVLEDAAKQMGNIIREQISDSTGSSWYDQAIANMRVSFFSSTCEDAKLTALAGLQTRNG
jgi:ATP-dependent DNA helicase 2 subunit 2